MVAEAETFIQEVGIDYITATSHQRHFADSFASFGSWLVSQEVAEGCKRSDYRASGYRGFSAGRAAVGVSRQGAIVRLSSKCAEENWEQLVDLADNVTRLDIQATIGGVDSPTSRIRSHHQELMRAPRFRGKPAQFKAFYGAGGCETINTGNRQSDRFGRIYDKWVESGLECYRGCVRYELELHRDVAFQTANQISTSTEGGALMLWTVAKFFSNRALVVPEFVRAGNLQPFASDRLRKGTCATEREIVIKELVRALRFMNVQVRPSVLRLWEAGYSKEVLAALGLSDLVLAIPSVCNSECSEIQKVS